MFRPTPPTAESFPHREQCALGLNTENTLSPFFFFFFYILTIRSDRPVYERTDGQTDRQTYR